MEINKTEALGAKVRLRYSIVINYIGRIAALLLNLMFVVIITRKLSTADFSAWIILIQYLNYIILLVPLVGVWAPRAISRGWNVSKTAWIMLIIIGIGISAISVIALYLIGTVIGLGLFPVLLFAFLIFEEYAARGGLVISSGYKPQHWGYYLIMTSAIKLVAGYVTIVVFELGLLGAILALAIARAIGAIYIYSANRKLLKSSSFSSKIAKIWLKRSWYSVSQAAAGLMISFDALLARLVTGSDLVVSYYGVAFFMINIFGSVSQSSIALSARILARRELDDFHEAVWLSLFFVFPMAMLIFAYTQPIVAVLGVKYIVVSTPIRIFVVGGIARSLYKIYKSTLNAWEHKDYNAFEEIKIRDTALFDTMVIEFATAITYLLGVVIIGMLVRDPIEIVYYWSIIYVARHIIGVFLFDWRARKRFRIRLLNRTILGYLARYSLVTIATIILCSWIQIEITERFYRMIMNLIWPTIYAVLIYAAILLLVDKKARALIKRAFTLVRAISSGNRNN